MSTTSQKTVLFSSQNQTLEQRLQHLPGESNVSDNEEMEYRKGCSGELCNSYKAIGTGLEGLVVEEYELINVHVMIRHGSRSPLHGQPHHRRKDIDCHFKSVKDSDPLAQRFYSAMTNLTLTMKTQGKPQHITFLPLRRKCKDAQLAGYGALQLLKLGQYLKKIYRKKLFPDCTGTVGNKQVYIRSTDYSRTFQSAIALLYGFFDTVNIINFPWEFSKYSSLCSSWLSHLKCDSPLAGNLHTTLHPLLDEIEARYQNITHGITDSRFVLYSGHDLTLQPLLGTLGIAGDDEHPPFAACLVLELYRMKEGGGHFLRVLYNGQDRTEMLRFCEIEDLVDGLCPLRHFCRFVYNKR